MITGNCGLSLAPLGGHEPVPPLNPVAGGADSAGPRFETLAGCFAALEASPLAINLASLVGHSNLRGVAMVALDRPADVANKVHAVADLLRGRSRLMASRHRDEANQALRRTGSTA